MTIQSGQSYNLSTGYFKVPTNGTYVFHYSSGLAPSVGIDLVLRINSFPITHIYRNSTVHNNNDVLSTAYAGTLTQNDLVNLYLSNGSSSSNSMRQTSWSAFMLDNLMDPLIVFCTRSSTDVVKFWPGLVNFTVTNVNIGNAWNSATDRFTAPRAGVYVFSLSFALASGKPGSVSIFVSSISGSAVFVVDLKMTNHNGYDMTGKTVALSLASGDSVYLFVYDEMYVDDLYLMSFTGFLYEPLNGRKVIWSVNLKNSVQGQYSPLPFDEVLVNVGGGWNITNNTFVAPYAGVYQLHLSADPWAATATDYKLMWNNVAYASIFSPNTAYNAQAAKSRAFMIKASVGDTFFIATTSTARLTGGIYRETSFTGYLISD